MHSAAINKMTPDLLRGLGVVIVRPIEQANATARLIEAAGGRAYVLPVLGIEPVVGPGLQDVIARLEDFNRAIFVSQNAVLHGLAAVRRVRDWPATLGAAAVGASRDSTPRRCWRCRSLRTSPASGW